MSYSYSDLKKIFSTARFPYNGKPIGCNTRIYDRDNHLAIRHHQTDILRFYPDGSKAICTGWTSVTTIARFREYIGLHVGMKKLPSFNGRRPDTERLYMLFGRYEDVVFQGVNGYIRIGADDHIDMSTVKEIEVGIMTPEGKKAVLPLRRKASAIADQVNIRVKLGVLPKNNWNSSRSWFAANLHVPLDQIDFGGAPTPFSVELSPMWFAEQVGGTATIKLKTF